MLPVEAILPALQSALGQYNRVVLIAPPGAGKTTRVPPALLDHPGRIVLLEPRRLAARAAARRMAQEMAEPVGRTVGFRVRGETRVSAATRIEVVTEGVLTRMIQDDPSLDGVATVIFDEFHQRSVIADTGLALVLGATQVLRDDLRVVVMSATLDAAAVARLMDNAPIIESAGRAWPVETRLAPRLTERSIEDHVAQIIRDTLASEQGSILVFLPGAAEIRRVEERIGDRLPPDVDLYPLHGSLPPEQQDSAIAAAAPGRRKVVLATNVAETSITIEGVRIVIDSGYERVPRFSPRNGMTRLETVRITRSSADQRRGRAGRTAPGVAIRCWSATEDAALAPAPRAEILDADLAPLVLDLAALGFADPVELPWLDPPPEAAFAVGRDLLHQLGALDSFHRITDHGKEMLEQGTQPRLAHLMLRAGEQNRESGVRAAVIAALLDERDLLRGDNGPPPIDIELRVDAVERRADGAMLAGATIDRGVMARVRERLANIGAKPGHGEAAESVGRIVAWGWPDRIARRRDEAGRFLLSNGRGVRVDSRDPLAHADWLVVPMVDDSGRDARAQLAAVLDGATIAAVIAERRQVVDEVEWDDANGGVVARRREMLGAIVLADHPLRNVDEQLVQQAMLAAIRSRGLDVLPWSDTARRVRERLAFVHHHDASWPDVSNAALLARLDEWLAPLLAGVRRLDQLSRVDLGVALLGLLDWEQRRQLDVLAPERITVTSGSRIAVDYGDPAAPVLAVRLQEVFGMMQSPALLGGRVPVTMHLLSPARRPVQVTRDLASFWKTGYFDVRKDLRGRYPKHKWPEDPTRT